MDRAVYIGIGSLFLGLVVNVFLASGGHNDLDIYLGGARDLLHGENIYLKKYNDWYSYFYSPLFALLVSPLLLVSSVLAKLIWGVLTLALLIRCYAILFADHLSATLSARQRNVIVLFSLLFLFQAVRDNINSSQVTIIVLWSCLEGLHRINDGRWLLGALLIALGIDMKLIPLVLLPYLIYRRQWRPALAVPVIVLVMQLLPALVVGWHQEVALLSSRLELIDPRGMQHIMDEEEPSFISLGALLTAYFSEQDGSANTLALPRMIASLSSGQLAQVLMVLRGAMVLLTLFFLRWPPFRSARTRQHGIWEVSYVLLCTVLIFPHQRYYSMLMMMPAVVWITFHTVVRSVDDRNRRRAWMVLCGLMYLITNADLLVGEYAPVYKHYKLLSFIVIGLMGMLMWCAPGASIDTEDIVERPKTGLPPLEGRKGSRAGV